MKVRISPALRMALRDHTARRAIGSRSGVMRLIFLGGKLWTVVVGSEKKKGDENGQ